MSRQERTASRVRKGTAKAEQVIKAVASTIRCKECNAKGRRYEDGSKEIKHNRECSRVRNAAGEPTVVAKKAKVPAQRKSAETARCPKCRQSGPSKKEIVHRVSCTSYGEGKVQPIARIVPGERAPQKPATSSPRKPSGTTPKEASSGGTVDLAAECKRLRDGEGMAWWRIGYELKLPGAANNVREGKGGAAQARRLYAQANNGIPHTPRTRSARERAEKTPRHAANVGTKTDRKIALVERGHVIPQDLSDEEVLAMVAGKVIEWGINVSRLCGDDDNELWLGQEARVHPVDVVMEEEPSKVDGSRVVRFREYLGIDSDTGRHMSGPTRTVRVNAIHTVR